MMDAFLEQINELNELQKELVQIHPLFTNHYPIVVANEMLLYMYDYSPEKQQYEWVKTVPDDLNIPEGCLAAMPVHHLDERTCAVVTDEAFQSFEMKIYLFHEFVHCYVHERYEHIGDRVKIKRAMEKRRRVTWELDYEFPYDDETIVQRIGTLQDALKQKKMDRIRQARQALFQALSEEAGEYWCWLEWNEGYARYIENRIRSRFGLALNHLGEDAPYNRLLFYECGSEYIRLLIEGNSELHTDLEQLFDILQSERLEQLQTH